VRGRTRNTYTADYSPLLNSRLAHIQLPFRPFLLQFGPIPRELKGSRNIRSQPSGRAPLMQTVCAACVCEPPPPPPYDLGMRVKSADLHGAVPELAIAAGREGRLFRDVGAPHDVRGLRGRGVVAPAVERGTRRHLRRGKRLHVDDVRLRGGLPGRPAARGERGLRRCGRWERARRVGAERRGEAVREEGHRAVHARAGQSATFHLPLLFITHPYIAHCLGACSAKREWSLFSLYPPPSAH